MPIISIHWQFAGRLRLLYSRRRLGLGRLANGFFASGYFRR
jgi:hypothetical protein